MTEERHALADLFDACWKAAAVKSGFVADPKAVLADTALEGLDVKVVENGDDWVHMLAGKPPSPASVSDAELHQAAGGKTGSTPVVHRGVLVCDWPRPSSVPIKDRRTD